MNDFYFFIVRGLDSRVDAALTCCQAVANVEVEVVVVSEATKNACGTAIRVGRRMMGAEEAYVVETQGNTYDVIARNTDFSAELQLPRDAINRVLKTGQTAVLITQHSAAFAPVFLNDNVIAVLVFQRSNPQGYSNVELNQINSIAQQIGAMEAEEAQESLKKATIADAFGLADSTSIVWGASEVEETEVDEEPPVDGPVLAFGPLKQTAYMSEQGLRDLLANSVTKLLENTEAHVAAVVLSTAAEPCNVVALAATADAPSVDSSQLVSRTVVRRVLESGLPLLTLDAGEDAVSEASKSVAKMSVTTVMCVPLLLRETDTVGVLYSATFSFSGKFDHGTLMSLMNDARALVQMLESLGQV